MISDRCTAILLWIVRKFLALLVLFFSIQFREEGKGAIKVCSCEHNPFCFGNKNIENLCFKGYLPGMKEEDMCFEFFEFCQIEKQCFWKSLFYEHFKIKCLQLILGRILYLDLCPPVFSILFCTRGPAHKSLNFDRICGPQGCSGPRGRSRPILPTPTWPLLPRPPVLCQKAPALHSTGPTSNWGQCQSASSRYEWGQCQQQVRVLGETKVCESKDFSVTSRGSPWWQRPEPCLSLAPH